MNNYQTQNTLLDALKLLGWSLCIFLFTASVLALIYACGFALGA
jgi:hypothetical protein